MKYSIFLTGLLVASLSIAAPAKKVAAKAKATKSAVTADKQKAPAATAPSTETPKATAPVTTEATSPSAAVPADASTTTAAIQAPTQAKITGILETRPTATFKGDDNITTENTVGLGYQFNPNFEVGAIQYFDTNLFTSLPSRTGADVIVQDGFVRAKFNNLVKTDTFSFSYEPRAYLPTNKGARDAGMVTVVRNYFKFAYKASNSVTLTAMELPIVKFFNKASFAGRANSAFENRVYLIADFDLGKGWAFSLPLYFHQTKFRTVTGAANSGKWDFLVYTWPEVTYAVTENVTLGVAYRSENLMTSTLGGFTLGDGIETGAFQAIMSVTL